jgi:hypothetical protein
MPSNTNEILAERQKSHGDFAEQAAMAQTLKKALSRGGRYRNLSDVQAEALSMICGKMARILCGDPVVKDHWDDIAGYATLASREIEKGEAKGEVNLSTK